MREKYTTQDGIENRRPRGLREFPPLPGAVDDKVASDELLARPGRRRGALSRLGGPAGRRRSIDRAAARRRLCRRVPERILGRRRRGDVRAARHQRTPIRSSRARCTLDEKFRDLKSDLLLVKPEGADRWLQFRDVYEVDGRAVRDRNERLTKLFLRPVVVLRGRSQKIIEESSRYNIGSVVPQRQHADAGAVGAAAGKPVPIRFRSRRRRGRMPICRAICGWSGIGKSPAETFIRGVQHQDLPVEGHFWIEPLSGRVLLSSLVANEPIGESADRRHLRARCESCNGSFRAK